MNLSKAAIAFYLQHGSIGIIDSIAEGTTKDFHVAKEILFGEGSFMEICGFLVNIWTDLECKWNHRLMRHYINVKLPELYRTLNQDFPGSRTDSVRCVGDYLMDVTNILAQVLPDDGKVGFDKLRDYQLGSGDKYSPVAAKQIAFFGSNQAMHRIGSLVHLMVEDDAGGIHINSGGIIGHEDAAKFAIKTFHYCHCFYYHDEFDFVGPEKTILEDRSNAVMSLLAVQLENYHDKASAEYRALKKALLGYLANKKKAKHVVQELVLVPLSADSVDDVVPGEDMCE